MKRQLLLILFTLIGLSGLAQTYTSIPAGFTPYGTQYYKNAAGTVIVGASGKTFRVVTQQSIIDSLLNANYYSKTVTDGKLALKVDAVAGKGLSTNDYTTPEKTKLAGIAIGATANQTDAYLLSRTNHTGTQAISTVSGLQTALDSKINTSQKGVTNGVATLGADGKVPNSQIPALAISETFPVASQASMLAISGADQGDVAVRTDISKSFILTQSPASVLSNWQELLTPTDAVQSVNGQSGNVNLTKADIGLSNVDNTSDAAKPVSVATSTALGLKLDLAGGVMTGDVVYGTFGGNFNPAAGKGALFTKNSDYGKIYYESSGDDVGDSNLIFEAGDNVSTGSGGTEGFLFRKWDGTSATDIVKANVTQFKYKTFDIYHSGNLTKSTLGLANVDNTSDAAKPVSTAGQTALNLKANIASPTFSGTVTAPTFSGSLTGTASNATTWKNWTLDDVASPTTGMYQMFGRDANNDIMRQYPVGAVQSFLGLGTAAYTSSGAYLPVLGNVTIDANMDNQTGAGKLFNATNVPTGNTFGTFLSYGVNQYTTQFSTSQNKNGPIYARVNGDGGSGTWNLLYHSGNFNPDNYLPLTGGTLTGGLTAPSFKSTGPINTDTREVRTYLPTNSSLTGDLVTGHEYTWYSDAWQVGATRSANTSISDFVVRLNGSKKFSISTSGDAAFSGAVTASPATNTNQLATLGQLNAAAGSSGTYTPTVTGVSNYTSSVPTIAHYTRVGDQVTVYGQLGITWPGVAFTEVYLSIPVASNFTITDDLSGVASSGSGVATNTRVTGNVAGDKASILFYASSAGNGSISYSFMYTVK
jgi:hypothetical protein